MPEPSILNVDDYGPGRYARTRLLQQIGIPVFEASTGRDALEIVNKHRPSIVLLDINLPDMTGFEVCKQIRANPETADITILHISASSVLVQHQVQGLNSGADGYLVEPIEPAVLIATVNAFLRARKAEDALRRSTEELRWFSYRVAHDLREPLRTITIYTQMLQHAASVDPHSENAKYLDFIGTAAGRMRAFMEGLLEYSQAGGVQNEMSVLDCQAILERVRANLDASIQESGASIVCDSLPSVYADARLEYVFQNLVSNAIKYRRQGVQPRITVSARLDGDNWIFAVKDNGIGIEAEYLAGVFEIFRRLHGQDVPGSGIGLALSRKIVEAHGGTIWIESKPGVGSTFFFTLPVVETLAADQPA